MKRILLFIICISLMLTGIIVRADEPEQNAGLLKAALDGDLVTVQTLLDECVDVNSKDSSGFTALIKASFRGHADIVKFLLDRGADLGVKNKHRLTALILASMGGNADIVQLLKNAGAKE